MEKLAVVYAGTNIGHMAIWLLIATVVGFAARKIVKGKSVLGLWGDAAFGLLGVFLIGTLLNAFNFSISTWIAGLNLGPLDTVAYWVDIFVVGFIGALLIRGILRPITG